jgi:hypothetical protein
MTDMSASAASASLTLGRAGELLIVTGLASARVAESGVIRR